MRKFLVDATGIVTFLAASYFWGLSHGEEKPGKKRSRGATFFLRSTAILLFLTPTLAMLGFIARDAAGNWSEFASAFTPLKIIGVSGLLVVAAIGIGLSRDFEGP